MFVKVDIGTKIEQIVCGAPNVKAGQYVVVAKVGAILPGNFEIKEANIRGVDSSGMICSLHELGWKIKILLKNLKRVFIILIINQKLVLMRLKH